MEALDTDKHLIRILVPPEEVEPKGLITWQYIWDGNICALLSEIQEDGTEKPGRVFILMDDKSGHTAKESLDEMVAGMEEQLRKAYEEQEHPLAVSDRNKKRPIGFRPNNPGL